MASFLLEQLTLLKPTQWGYKTNNTRIIESFSILSCHHVIISVNLGCISSNALLRHSKCAVHKYFSVKGLPAKPYHKAQKKLFSHVSSILAPLHNLTWSWFYLYSPTENTHWFSSDKIHANFKKVSLHLKPRLGMLPWARLLGGLDGRLEKSSWMLKSKKAQTEED